MSTTIRLLTLQRNEQGRPGLCCQRKEKGSLNPTVRASRNKIGPHSLWVLHRVAWRKVCLESLPHYGTYNNTQQMVITVFV